MARTLIKNGSLVTVDDKFGDIPGGDILIEDDKIVAIGRKLAAGGAQVIDATGMVVIPGLINSHIHTWEIALRGIAEHTRSKRSRAEDAKLRSALTDLGLAKQ
jgi:cytosine/adenosine deaminase-related metal-dependent hydrolase